MFFSLAVSASFLAQACKNVVLAGIGSVTLVDDSPLSSTSADLIFLVTSDQLSDSEEKKLTLAEACAASLQDFNPMVRISVKKGELSCLDLEYNSAKFGSILCFTFCS